jgi:hypothetical protein
MKDIFKRTLKALASVKLAVVIILCLGGIIAWGTLVEAHFQDSVAAQKIVYHSVWMYTTMSALATCLIAVMIDRWPWKVRHMGFIFAHIGILVLMAGSIVTSVWGIDGSMALGIGEKANHVAMSQTDFVVYTSMDGEKWTKVFDHEVDFFLRRPSEKSPYEVPLPAGNLKVTEFLPYALRDEKIVEATGSDIINTGAAVRFQLQNERANLTEWLLQPAPGRDVEKDLGPAQVILASEGSNPPTNNRNTLIIRAKAGTDVLDYEIHTARTSQIKRGKVSAGETVETGWMGLVLRVLKYIPHAKEQVTYQAVGQATPVTTGAIKINYNGTERWMGLNSNLKLFSDEAVYVVTFGNRRLDLGFSLQLKSFKVGRYQGTMRAASYESVVDVPGIGNHEISMNEPLKFKGYTFYQSSFNEDERNNPTASILSVNWDPGRWIKYLGCLLIVFGIIHLFYFKRKMARANLR